MAKIPKKTIAKSNVELKPIQQSVKQPITADYYEGSFWKKMRDFCIGFFWPYAALLILVFVPNLGYLLNIPSGNGIFTILGIILSLAVGVLFLIFLVKNAKERRYVVIGFVAALVAPLVFFIGCLIVLSSIGFTA